MFDLSMAEIGVIGVVALLVLGPERLPKAARMVGFYVRKARQSWYSVRSEFERELAAEELKRSLKLDEVHATLQDTAKELQNDLASAGAAISAAGTDANAALSARGGADPLPDALRAPETSPGAGETEDFDGLSPEELARQREAMPELSVDSADDRPFESGIESVTGAKAVDAMRFPADTAEADPDTRTLPRAEGPARHA